MQTTCAHTHYTTHTPGLKTHNGALGAAHSLRGSALLVKEGDHSAAEFAVKPTLIRQHTHAFLHTLINSGNTAHSGGGLWEGLGWTRTGIPEDQGKATAAAGAGGTHFYDYEKASHVMVKPVVTCVGHTYEEGALREAFKRQDAPYACPRHANDAVLLWGAVAV